MKSRVIHLVSFGAIAFALLGCSKEAKPSAEQPKAADKTPTSITPAAATPDKAGTEPAAGATDEKGGSEGDELKSAKSSYSESNFDLSIKTKGDYKAGQAGEATIELNAKAPFHANDKYPYKFKLADSAGVEFPDKVVPKDKAKLEHMKVVMPVSFTPKEAGKKKIDGVFHFSICTEDKCLIEKRGLTLAVDVAK
jgi:hypothetical protein